MVETVYRTEDGEVWDSLEEAEDHQKKVNLWQQITELYGSYGEVRLNYFSDFLEVIRYYEDNK